MSDKHGFTYLFLSLFLLLIPQLASAISVEDTLNRVYDGYDKKNGCWRARADDPEYYYCLRIDRTDNLKTDTGTRIYVLLSGEKMDMQGDSASSHVDPGMVGALIIGEGQDGKPEIIAGDPRIFIGAFAQGPTKWELVKLGPTDYWGWKNTWGDAHQGISGTRVSILAPYGKRIRDLAGFVDSFSDAGYDDDKNRPVTDLESEFEIDSTQINAKVFPLIMRVSGELDGKPFKTTTWEFPFDTKAWSYTEPADWPLANREF